MRTPHFFVVAILLAFLPASTLIAADPPKPAPAEKEPPKASSLPGEYIGCAFLSKNLDAKNHKLTYQLKISNKLAKPIIRFTGFFVWRDPTSKIVLHEWLEITYDDKPLAPGAIAIYESSNDAPRKADAAQIAQWEKEATGLTTVNMKVLKVTYADRTEQVFKTIISLPKDAEPD